VSVRHGGGLGCKRFEDGRSLLKRPRRGECQYELGVDFTSFLLPSVDPKPPSHHLRAYATPVVG
jgi:hypothetical protein